MMARSQSTPTEVEVAKDPSGHAGTEAVHHSQAAAEPLSKIRYEIDDFREILDSLGDGVIVADESGRVLLMNPAARQIVGRGPTNATPESWTERFGVYLPDAKTPCPTDQVPLYRAIQGHAVDGAEIYLRGPNELKGRWLNVTARPLKRQPGEPRAGVSVFRDITHQKIHDAALRDSEQRFRQLAENIREVFWIISADRTEMIYVSPIYEEVFGRTTEELYREPTAFLQAVHPDDRERVQERISSPVLEVFRHEVRIVHQDGSIRWVRTSGFPVADAQGVVYRIVGITEDITDQKAAAVALERQAQRQSVIASLGRLAVFSSARTELVQEAARRIGQLFQADFCGVAELSPDEKKLVIRSVSGTSEPASADIHSNATSYDLSQTLGSIAIRTGEPVVMPDVDQETRIDTKLLRRIGVVSAVVLPLKLHHRYFGTLGVHSKTRRDFSAEDVKFLESVAHLLAGAIERQDAEDRLRQSEAKFRSLIESSPDIIMTVGRDHTVIFNNDLPPEVQIGRPGTSARLCFPPPQRIRFDQALASVFDRGQSDSFEYSTADEHWWSVRVVPLRVENGVHAAMVVSTDITARKQAECSLRRNQQMLQQALVAHEADRQLIAYEIHDGMTQDAAGAMLHLEAAMPEADRLSPRAQEQLGIVRRLLRRTIDEGRRMISGLRPPIIDESGTIAAIDFLIRERHTISCVDVEFVHDVQFDRLEPLIEGTIYRIVQEALTNVQRHSRSPRARVSIVQKGERIELEIKDWGVGFDPSRVGGRRFGLNGVRERARLLGGTALVESRCDEGTRIFVELPVSTQRIATDDLPA